MTEEFEIQDAACPPRKPIVLNAPASVDKACIAHEEAYKKVFGVVPTGYTYDVDSRMIYVGSDAGVSLKRLKELTRMLNWRA
ncbi:hypothetical protein [Xanthomonas phage Suba]|uniref:Uncharacterized protein n=1 Tax=Xanthomonas phage Suba TaxID=2674975 RepID=A0A679KLK8_9CAUD|nr:hypothetical protein QAY88_gp44 [Xanthomonas phage Suba]CAA2409857.1 hypothetical protein [Xanthomonas phage Suba]